MVFLVTCLKKSSISSDKKGRTSLVWICEEVITKDGWIHLPQMAQYAQVRLSRLVP